MKIFVQGTKGGYNVLYPKPTPNEFFQFACDMRRIDVNNGAFCRKSLYSLAFANGGCIFTKYVLVHDEQRYSLGNIGLSIFISKDNKILGADAKALLDELANIYVSNYCPDYNLGSKREDWILLQSPADKYDSHLQRLSPDDIDDLQSGTTDAAFIYYRDDAELQRYFNAPYQEEYTPYRQILFISGDLKDKPENPLNALRHSGNDLTGEIDLEYAKLKDFHGVGKNKLDIEILANGKRCSNKDKIYRKDHVSITYSKRYYQSIHKEGKLNDENIKKYLFIDEDNKKIEVKKDIELEPEEKNITLNVKDRRGNPVTNVAITLTCKVDNYYPPKTVTNNQITFKGEEIGQTWSISVQANNLFLADFCFSPGNQGSLLLLPLREYKNVEIIATDERGRPVDGFTVRIVEYDYSVENPRISFVDDQIYQPCNIVVSKEEKDVCYSGTAKFRPKDEDKISVPLKPQIKLPKKKSSTAKLKRLKIIILIGSIVVFVVLLILLFSLNGKKSQDPIPATQIETYVQGIELNLDTLNHYKAQWEKQIEEGGSLWSLFGFGKKTIDTTKYKETLQSIDSAIEKRKLINDRDFAKLKGLCYAPAQQKFKNTVGKIDSSKYYEISQKLDYISTLNLNQIADSIKDILKRPKEVPEKGKDAGQPDKQSVQTSNKRSSIQSQQEKFEKDFWELVKKPGMPQKKDYDNWFKSGSQISAQHEFKQFYDTYLTKSENFEKFKVIPESDRKRAADSKDLKNLKNKIPSNNESIKN